MTLHFAQGPVDERALWRDAVLFLALTENCGEVRLDYEMKDSWKETVREYDPDKESNRISVEEESIPITKLRMMYCISPTDINETLGIENIKEYAASPEKIEELLGLLERVDVITFEQVIAFSEMDGTSAFIAGK